MIKTRPSSMPRVWDCPGALVPTDVPINIPSDESDLGLAAHEALALHALGQEADTAKIAAKHGVRAEDLAPLYGYGVVAWRDLSRYFASVRVEVEFPETDITTGGHADLFHGDGETLVIGDWKSGRVRRQYRQQLRSYAYEARDRYGMPRSGVITAAVVWLRYGEFKVLEFDDADLDIFANEYKAKASRADKQYAPGEHCQGCPRQLECPARDAFLRSAAIVVSEGFDVIPAERLAEVYTRIQIVERAIESYRKALRMAVEQHGELALGDGRLLRLQEQGRDQIDARAAWPVLEAAGLTQDDLARVTSISKGELLDIVGERSARGEKGKRKMQITEELRRAGAITTTTHQRIELVGSKGGS